MNQFDLMRKNDRFVWFMIDELIHNKENLTKIMEIVLPKVTGYIQCVNDMLEKVEMNQQIESEKQEIDKLLVEIERQKKR